MNKLSNFQDRNEGAVKCGKLDEACRRYSLGRTSMRNLGSQAGAIVWIGKSVLYNFSILDSYFDSISGGD